MEAQGRLSHLVDGAPALVIKVIHNRLVAQVVGQTLRIQRPGVDMGVNLEVGGCTEKERLRLFPISAGCQKILAGLVYVGLGPAVGPGLFHCAEVIVELCAGRRQIAVNRIYHIGDVSLYGLLDLFFVRRKFAAPFRIAGSEHECACCDG